MNKRNIRHKPTEPKGNNQDLEDEEHNYAIRYSSIGFEVAVVGHNPVWVERWAYLLLHSTDPKRFPNASEEPKEDNL